MSAAAGEKARRPLTVYSFGPAFGVPDMSPFVVKLMTYLRMAGTPYEAKPGDPRKAPKKKLPYVVDDGAIVCDTRLIIEHLETKRGASLDARLSPKERAVAAAFQSMLDEHMYWVMVYERWQVEDNWKKILPVMQKLLARSGLPGPLTGFVAGRVRSDMLKQAYAQGTGRHTHAEVGAIGERIAFALSEQIGDGPFFFGADPSTTDASAYGFLVSLLDTPFEGPVKAAAARKGNLRAYVDRIKERYWKT